jgi:hypothetical protein
VTDQASPFKAGTFLRIQRKKYLLYKERVGGDAPGFREWIKIQIDENPALFAKSVLEAWMEAATKIWQEQPRKDGPDLFSIAGYTIPEHLTRPAPGQNIEGDMGDAEQREHFEKVDQSFATVSDLIDDATIKLRKAAQSAAAAEQEMKAADEARRRAQGNRNKLLKDVRDK